MTRLRSILFAALAVMCMGAISASAASAFEFEQTEVETEKTPHKVTGKSQKLTAEGSEKADGKVVITCEKVKGTAKFTKTELTGKPEYEGCNVAGKAAKVITACTVGTTNGAATKEPFTGKANVGKGEKEGEKDKTCFTIETNDKSCTVIIKGEQLGKEKITYKNNAKNLIGEASVTGLAFETATGKACTFGKDAVTGTSGYAGTAETTGINIK